MINPVIAKEIIEMCNADLNLRQSLLEKGTLKDGYDQAMEKIHIQNANRLQEIIDKIGYPNESKVGEEASEAAWLIIQHAISLPKFMIQCLQLMEEELQQDGIDVRNYVYLKDRIAMFQGKPQSFGTQFDFDDKGLLSIYELDDTAENINLKREEIGLNSIEERQAELTAESAKYNLDQQDIEKIKQKKIAFEKWKIEKGWTVQ